MNNRYIYIWYILLSWNKIDFLWIWFEKTVNPINHAKIKYQLYLKSAKLDAFEQKICNVTTLYIYIYIYIYSMFDWSRNDWFILLFLFRVFLNFEKYLFRLSKKFWGLWRRTMWWSRILFSSYQQDNLPSSG